jgi:hypothetical protein
MAITNSKDKQLSTSEVIAGAVAEASRDDRLRNIPVQAALLAIVQEGAMPNTTVEQIGNTVFITHYSEDKAEVAMRALNVDTARNYLDNSLQYITKLSESGVTRMTSDFTDKRILQLFNTIARRPEFSHWGMEVRKLSSGGMRAYVVMPNKE